MPVIVPPTRVLIVSPTHAERSDLIIDLELHGHLVGWRGTSDEAQEAALADEYEIALVTGPVAEAVALCSQLRSVRPELSVVIGLTEPSFEAAQSAIRAGAADVLSEPASTGEFMDVLSRSHRARALRSEVVRLRQVLAEAKGFEDLLGSSQPMQKMYSMLERAAGTNASVLITGESGTGKELVARSLHRRSKRHEGPFVAVNCSALPENLLESELFGHVKGAFTDARVARSGLFVRANGGTLLLDEVGELPAALQPKLLRALQERRVRPVGADTEVPFDVRFVAATNRNLEAEVADKTFREDLFYRINVIHIDVPPLRDRGGDILVLADHYISHFSSQLEKAVGGMSHDVAKRLIAYNWPGNVRELQNCMERAVALARTEVIEVDDLPEKLRKFRRSHVLVVSNSPSELLPMEEVERRYVMRVLEAVGHNKKEAARVLGFDRKTLYRKLARYGVERPASKAAD